MSDALLLMSALVAGLMLGLLFYGGLWWTVRKGMASPYPALWFLGSLMVRTGLALAVFVLVSAGHWERLLACLAGFMVARFGVTWVTARHPRRAPEVMAKEATDAPQPR